MDIFKEYDIRGIYPEELNGEKAERIAKAIGTITQDETIFIGHDNRFGSLEINEYVKQGLASTGKRVVELGLVPVMLPAFASYTKKASAISITASHNPAKYTGILLYKNGVTITPERIKEAYDSAKFAQGKGAHGNADLVPAYLEYATKGMPKLGLKIGVDTMGGATTHIARQLFEKLEAKLVMLHANFDSEFFGKTPEPNKESAKELGKLVSESGLDFGAQLDGDGDRVAFVDEHGNYIDPMNVAMIFIKYLGFKKVLATVACSRKLEKFASITYSQIGRPYMEAQMLKGGFDLGVETSLHIYFGAYYPFSDGLLATALMAKVLQSTGKSLSRLVSEFPKVFFGEFSIEIDKEEEKQRIMTHIEEAAQAYGKIDKTDGIKIFLQDGFLLFRKSKTEPKIRAYYEGADDSSFRSHEKLAHEILERASNEA